MSADHEWLRTKIRDILAVTSRGHSRERFLEVETLVCQMRDHLDRVGIEATLALAAPADGDASHAADDRRELDHG